MSLLHKRYLPGERCQTRGHQRCTKNIGLLAGGQSKATGTDDVLRLACCLQLVLFFLHHEATYHYMSSESQGVSPVFLQSCHLEREKQ